MIYLNTECPACFNIFTQDNSFKVLDCQHAICNLCEGVWQLHCFNKKENPSCMICRRIYKEDISKKSVQELCQLGQLAIQISSSSPIRQ